MRLPPWQTSGSTLDREALIMMRRHERTAAMLAAEIGKATFIEALVLGGADVNFVDA